VARRLCQYCTARLGRFAKLLHVYTCKNCAYRMSMGTSPSKPPKDEGGSR